MYSKNITVRVQKVVLIDNDDRAAAEILKLNHFFVCVTGNPLVKGKWGIS